MSHQSGFRRGGRDFSRRENPTSARRGRDSRQFDQQLEQRFHEHEREATTQPSTEEVTPEKEEAPEA